MPKFTDEELLSIADEILQSVMQTDMYSNIQLKDPFIIESETHMEEQLKKIKPLVSKEVYDELVDSISEVIASYLNPCVLYGMAVQQALMFASQNPLDMEKYIYDRVCSKTTEK